MPNHHTSLTGETGEDVAADPVENIDTNQNTPKPQPFSSSALRSSTADRAKLLTANKVPVALDLKTEVVPIKSLKPYRRNARKHSNQQVGQIAKSIEQFGFINPILIDGKNRIIRGHGSVRAANLLAMTSVPATRIEHLSDAQRRAYIIADNRLAELAEWDDEILAIELQELTSIDLDFDITITGFEIGEIDLRIDGLDASGTEDEADMLPEIEQSRPTVTKPGDLFRMGRHRLLCADATEPLSFKRLLQGECAQMIFIDPPYNVPIEGNVSGLGAVKHADFAMAAGEMSEAKFTAFLESAFANLSGHSIDGSIHFIFTDWRHLREMLAAGHRTYTELKNLCVWCKTNGGMGSLYRSRHELILVFKRGTAPHINNVELGRHGRYRTNVWEYPGVNAFGADRDEALTMHPTVKPVALVADAIKDCSKRNGIVLDAFAGSGTTIIAAERTGRRGYAMELDPHYVDVAIRRWQQLTAEDAIHVESGLTFNALR